MFLRTMERTMERTTIDADAVRQGLNRGEMSLVYLPTMSLPDGRCIGAEALTRWRHGTSLVMPDEFIPLIENTPVSGMLTYWVIETIAHELGAWLRKENGVYVSINVPPEILGRGGLEYAAAKAGLGDLVAKLVLEVTERGVPDQLGIDSLNDAAHRGIRIALDDVGVYGTNLAILVRAQIEMIKLDKTLLDQGASELARIVHAVHADVVAEGVESAEQADIVREAGIKYVQGFYFSPPLAAQDFQTFHLAHR